ncbi:putative short-chain dehydrogenases/reductase [Xylariales sp. PMI_506]|nr:putative short-chain dehydrogenases/reductase [Xylariales sp. PMI_506]
MVSLDDVTLSNRRIASTFPNGLVAVFVGGTSGIGEYTLKALAAHAVASRIYIVGRAQAAASGIIEECKELSPTSQFEFIQADISLISVVDDVCRQIKSKETAINILFQSQGTLARNPVTSDGLSLQVALKLHSRTRFILNLLPLLRNATSLRRVVSVLVGTKEGPINVDNLAGENLTVMESRYQSASMVTLLLEEAARRAPDVSFIHDYPGFVKSGIMNTIDNPISYVIGNAVAFVTGLFIGISPEESGERHLFLSTSGRYPPGQSDASIVGVAVNGDMSVAKGSNGKAGSGVYTVDERCESGGAQVDAQLDKLREDGTAQKVREHIEADFIRITGSVSEV